MYNLLFNCRHSSRQSFFSSSNLSTASNLHEKEETVALEKKQKKRDK